MFGFCPDGTAISSDRCGVTPRTSPMKSGGAEVAAYVPSDVDIMKLLTGKDFKIEDFVSYSGNCQFDPVYIHLRFLDNP